MRLDQYHSDRRTRPPRESQLHAGPQFRLALLVEGKCIALAPNLLAFENAVCPVANPPDVATGFAFPASRGLDRRFAWHFVPSTITVSKYHHKYHQCLESAKKPLDVRGFH